MSTLVDLNRRSYLRVGGTLKHPIVSYLSARYKNLRQQLPADTLYMVTLADTANAPGIAFNVYGDRFYWWVVCFYNGIINPISDLKPGVLLELPNLEDINALLSVALTSLSEADANIII
jgi:hypothetical protein